MSETRLVRLERRYKQLKRRQDDVEFLRQINTYLASLDSERPVRRILKRLRKDAEAAVDHFNLFERNFVEEAVEVRRRLAEAAPEIDNSNEREPAATSHARASWSLDSFASFDRLSGDQRRIEFAPLPYYDVGDKAPLGTMLIILQGRLRAAQYGEDAGELEGRENRRPDMDDFGREIHNIQEKHSAELNRFKELGRVLPGLADERLRAIIAALEPEPFLIDEGEDEDAIAERAFRRGLQQLGIIGVMRNALTGQRLDEGEKHVFGEAVSFLRGEAERLHEEIMQRLSRGEGTSRMARFLVFTGRGSLKLGVFIAGAVVAAIIALLVSAYVAKWLPGQGGGNEESASRSASLRHPA